MQHPSDPTFISFMPLLLVSLALAVSAYFLAKDKGRAPFRWALVCLIPGFNAACIFFLAGSTSLRLERKIDALLAQRDQASVGRQI
ncbi:hypothetical protein [Paraburkholderia phenoliruptrix]|uniref:hypothetical protein n=1 Tax=Paraburkholderia phenoliruptrix TaxID=252970 RepID=UPI000AC544EB|nr:hypothetical protein [Paraburkholderia phenoliruptrix]